MTPGKPELQTETLELIKDEVESRFKRQFDSLTAIDTKAGLVVGYALTAAAFLATRKAQPILVGLADGAYLVAAGFGVATLAVRHYQDVGARALFNSHARHSRAAALAAVTANQIKQLEFNDGILRKKARQWWISLAMLMLATLLMIAAILVQTYQHEHTGPNRGKAISSPLVRHRSGFDDRTEYGAG
jgi:hypothetical protein